MQTPDNQKDNFPFEAIKIKNIQKIMTVFNYKTVSDFANAIGISQGYLSEIINRKKSVPKTLGAKLEDKLHVRRFWFDTGMGDMFLKDHMPERQMATNELNEPTTEYSVLDKAKGVGVPVYYSDLSTGLFDNKSIQPVGYLNVPEFHGCDAIIRVKDDSMAERMNERDWIGIKKINNWQQFLPLGYIYAIATDEVDLVRTVKKGTTEDNFRLVSHNKNYEENEIPKKIIKEVWSVKTILPYSKIETLL